MRILFLLLTFICLSISVKAGGLIFGNICRDFCPEGSIATCKACSKIEKKIRKCKNGVKERDCALCISNCKICSDNITCDQCLHPTEKTQFILSNSKKCVEVETVQNCQKYDLQSTKCYECDEGYILNDDICVQYVQGCQVYEQIQDTENGNLMHVCKTCIEEKYLNYHNMCLEKIENCVEYEKASQVKKCLKCDENYWMIENQCVFQDKIIEKMIESEQTMNEKNDGEQKEEEEESEIGETEEKKEGETEREIEGETEENTNSENERKTKEKPIGEMEHGLEEEETKEKPKGETEKEKNQGQSISQKILFAVSFLVLYALAYIFKNHCQKMNKRKQKYLKTPKQKEDTEIQMTDW